MKIFRTQKVFLVLFFLGFLTGILFANFIADTYVIQTDLFREYYLGEFLNQKTLTEDYFIYVLILRILPFTLFYALQYTKLRKIGIVLGILWTGFSCGLLISVEILNLGAVGMLLFCAGLCPQAILYTIAYLILFINMFENSQPKWTFQKYISMIIIIIIGILCEVLMNPWCVKWVIRNFILH